MADDSLERRVEALEREVRELRLLTRWRAPERAPKAPATPVDPSAPPRSSGDVDYTTGIIAKIGIALVLLGLGFLLKFSYDQGWLSETARVVMGFVAGLALLAGGTHQRRDNPILSAVLFGGSIAAFYGSTFAAHDLYDLIAWPAAMASMIGTTMLGFFLAVTHDRSAIASIAAIGGFATPFLLDTPDAGPELLAVYTMVLLAGTSAIYLLRGWRSLLVTTGLGGFVVMCAAAHDAAPGGTSLPLFLVTTATFVSVASAAIVPILRRELRGEALDGVEQVMALFAPLAAIGVFDILSADSTTMLVGLVAGLATISAAVHTLTRDTTWVSSSTAAALAAAAAGIAAGVEPVAMALLGFGVAANIVGARGSALVRLPGYLGLGVVGLWTFGLLFSDPVEPAFLNADGLQMLLATAALLVVAATCENRWPRWAHIYVATAAGLATIAQQLAETAGGQVVATGLWGALALAALAAGLIRHHARMQVLGIGVMLLTSVKLLGFDLESMETIWRVALLLAFGTAMLYLSYRLPRWQKASAR